MADNNRRPEKPCKKCQRRTTAEGYICRFCRAARPSHQRPGKQRPVPCLTCGNGTRAKDRICRPCTEAAEEFEAPSPTYLCDGRWVPHRGILRWVAA